MQCWKEVEWVSRLCPNFWVTRNICAAQAVEASRPWRSTQLPNGWTHDLNQYRFLIQSYLQKASGRDVRTHPPMVLSAMAREINQLAFYQVQQVYLPLCVKVHIYGTRSFVSLFNGKEIFWIIVMPLGGGRVIMTLRAAVRDRGK